MSPLDTELNNTLGCSFIGILFGILLYGLTSAQTLYYFQRYPIDGVRLKLFVVTLWLLDTSRTILGSWCNWTWVITNHANLLALFKIPRCGQADFFIEGLTVFIVQISSSRIATTLGSYFVRCIWRTVEHKWYQLPLAAIVVGVKIYAAGKLDRWFTQGLICLGAFGDLFSVSNAELYSFVNFGNFGAVFGIVTIYNMNRTLDMTIALQESTASGCAHVLMAGVADIYIAISLVVILRRQRTGFHRTENTHRTNHLVTGLMLYTIHRGIIVAYVNVLSVAQLLEFSLFVGTLHANPFKLYWLIFHYPGSKLYVNSLLALLNLRDHLRGGSLIAHAEDNVLLSIQGEKKESDRHVAYPLTVRSPPGELDDIAY
ncbi:hypothetical protein POSPLADRAFT_1036024 [Postia placenta MAD-698-R-SB12]|uniref:DUF6534 domain-containing protein n=1 Tax=Postia placenta MAD-698-R-SB12 TaxID=670580 RepID=A0A1X6MRF8_9APHY|nr:hypothetical protein POSPLADRAFT_1036024 [Postia placenta MAD-698-R-SB12]OSX58968.1 hypothetical protein POSPLADRAFT_1036024 [Postia placenta MAD-698-R-SB12]